MKKIIVGLILPLIAFAAYAGKKVVHDGVEYEISGLNGVTCRAKDKSQLTDVVILHNVTIDGRNYLVTEVAKGGFKNCKNLKSIELPRSIRKINAEAFWNCKNLESVIMPDECEAVVPEGSYGFGQFGVFRGCTSLKRMRGISKLYPAYMVYEALYNCPEVPFNDEVKNLSKEQLEAMTLNSNFYEFATPRVKQAVEGWQKRKPYETMAQWESRVSESNRKKMIDEALASSHAEFMKLYAPARLKGTLEEYNPEYGFFTVYLGELGNVYAYVPQAEATHFSENWDNVVLKPKYGVMDNVISVLSCDFELDGKVYKAPTAYAEDTFEDVVLAVTPLSAIKEYELAMEHRNAEGEKSGRKVYEADMVDFDIPSTSLNNPNTFAVIIGNENYQRVSKVDYALNDARVFAKYCNLTLGVPEQNIRIYNDATFGDIAAAMTDINEICRAYNGKARVIFYYAGHGVPDDSNRNAYLLPVDANGSQFETCYALSKVYEQLGNLQAESVVTLIDACFSGSLRGEGMLASARGIKLKPREVKVGGNMVVMTAATGDQTALPYHEKNHGLFTYYLLSKLRDSKGDVTLGDLADYLHTEVAKQAIVVNKKPQTPDLKVATALNESWRDMKLN
ncbi:MAG: caspase family protein [Paramuribaculum sp.]|nr:caspase family protein [Paramuribaculum sp.]